MVYPEYTIRAVKVTIISWYVLFSHGSHGLSSLICLPFGVEVLNEFLI